jgi:medium-chain acyl-[acyl-carrier-protein] hydrolase
MTPVLAPARPTAAGSTPWLAYRRPSAAAAALRLFCFPYAGGGASVYQRWTETLPPSIEVCPVQLPGRERRIGEPAFTSVDAMVRAMVPALRPFMDLPFALFGHSMGALVAYEAARALRGAGAEPVRLFVSGRRAPVVPDPAPPLHALPDAAFADELRRLGGTPEELLANREIMEMLLPTLRADMAVCETYRHLPAAPLACPVSALGGVDDPELGTAELDPWGRETAGAFTRRLFPGGHFFVNTARAQVLRAVAADLARDMETVR